MKLHFHILIQPKHFPDVDSKSNWFKNVVKVLIAEKTKLHMERFHEQHIGGAYLKNKSDILVLKK